MKFLIAGFGSIGRRHMRNLLALGEKDIVLYRTRQSTLPDDEIKGFQVETDLQRALDARPDAVIISNPTACHLDIAIPAAEQGCHLLIEKPVSHNRERVADLKKITEKSGSRVLMGFQFRFHPGLNKINQVLKSGEVGRPISLRAHWGEYLPDWHPWEDYRRSYSARADLGGSVALTLSHPLDYLRWLMGDAEVLWSIGNKVSDLEVEVEDIAEFGLKFANGAVGSVHLDYFQRPADHHLEIICSHGFIRWNNADGAVNLYTAANGQWINYPVPADFERNVMFMDEMSHFIRLCKGEVESICSLDDGIKALELALNAVR
ncbi:MAG: Gfo/Idh/MocA family oxidoreductase [Anaerolineae bacterium]|nr:Gfo/Idh/MocA family oxidoreductase [Anaerolineae bacterium]